VPLHPTRNRAGLLLTETRPDLVKRPSRATEEKHNLVLAMQERDLTLHLARAVHLPDPNRMRDVPWDLDVHLAPLEWWSSLLTPPMAGVVRLHDAFKHVLLEILRHNIPQM